MKRLAVMIALLLWTVTWFHGLPSSALAITGLSPGAETQADEKTKKEILAMFKQAEGAMQARNLDELMALYSRDYAYHGLTKAEVRKLWGDLFAQYHRIASTHHFSQIAVKPGQSPTAEVNCTGALWATDETGRRANIDSWFEELHYLVYEDGAWRIRGHAGERPKGIWFGVAPHPLF